MLHQDGQLKNKVMGIAERDLNTPGIEVCSAVKKEEEARWEEMEKAKAAKTGIVGMQNEFLVLLRKLLLCLSPQPFTTHRHITLSLYLNRLQEEGEDAAPKCPQLQPTNPYFQKTMAPRPSLV
ncbi:hypothetical protein AYL99_11712 [Fonsecaea erecta]|uniref:Uncharacterized protein n=1 Tax=Fonsecaea erecta TaxID=1367422 RepID=A0A178Z372_9EURO|nr:hypothetical protein AYL99_11712 [Fonsecaea erecta]OAP54177.1 hypothetical protein AYL99_11712 [Fonsecaea erecta]